MNSSISGTPYFPANQEGEGVSDMVNIVRVVLKPEEKYIQNIRGLMHMEIK